MPYVLGKLTVDQYNTLHRAAHPITCGHGKTR
jgi:hypothetical protein